jgi:hypothetical protein
VLQQGDLMGQGKILHLQGQVGSEAGPQGMKPDENGRFHRTGRLPAEAANRNECNAVGIIYARQQLPGQITMFWVDFLQRQLRF